MTSCIAQFTFFLYRPKPIRVDFSGGQISSDAGLLLLRAFDQRHGLTRDVAQRLSDPLDDERVQHSVLSLLRQSLYQIVAGYEDANDADRLRYDPAFQQFNRPVNRCLLKSYRVFCRPFNDLGKSPGKFFLVGAAQPGSRRALRHELGARATLPPARFL
jgi:hypothetical protein